MYWNMIFITIENVLVLKLLHGHLITPLAYSTNNASLVLESGLNLIPG